MATALGQRLRRLWLERVRLPLDVRHVHGPTRLSYGEDEVVLVCLVRNGAPYLPSFVPHYLDLGVRHLVFLDNGSTDGTIDIAQRYPGVSVLRTTVPFRGNDRSMRRYLVRRFAAPDRWVLCVDIDELFDYPASDRLPLRGLLRYLRSRSYTAMAAYLLDMFSDRPLIGPSCPPAADGGRVPLREAEPYYDVSAVERRGYFEEDSDGSQRFVRHNRLANPEVKRYVGGIRARAFGLREVYLLKHPLLLRDGRVELVHQHYVDHAHVADVTGALYHYKFVEGFAARVDEAVRERQYAADSYDYRHYQRALRERPDLRLPLDAARRLRSVNQLVDEGFLQATADYRRWVEDADAPFLARGGARG